MGVAQFALAQASLAEIASVGGAKRPPPTRRTVRALKDQNLAPESR